METEIIERYIDNLKITEEKQIKKLSNSKFNEEFEQIYEDNEFAKSMSKRRKIVIKEIIKKTLICTEINDIYSFSKLYEDIVSLKFELWKKSEIESMINCCDILIVKNFMDINFIKKPFKIISKFVKEFKGTIKIKLDWKIYYKIFHIVLGESCYEFYYIKPLDSQEEISNFFFKCKNLFEIKDDEISFLKSEVLGYIYSGSDTKITLGLKILNSFFPKKSIDVDIQNALYKLLIKKNHMAMMIFTIFKKVVRTGELKIDVHCFINNFFNILNKFMLGSISLGYGFPVSKRKKSKSKKQDYPKDMIYILCAFLFEEHYSRFKNNTDKQFQVIVNLINYNLKENSKKSVINFNLNFLLHFFKSIKDYIFLKEKKQISESKIEVDFKPKLIMKDRLNEILLVIEPLMIKNLFYDEKSAVNVTREAQIICEMTEINDNIQEAFIYLYENSDNNFSAFISKLNAYLKVLIKADIFTNKKEVVIFLKDIINSSIEKISSVSMEQNINIISFFTTLFLLCNTYKEKDEYLKSVYFADFILLVKKSANLLIIKLIKHFELFSTSNKIDNIKLLLVVTQSLLEENDLNEIIDLIVNYAKENIIEAKHIHNYFTIVNSKRLSNKANNLLWKYCYKSLIMITNKEELQISEKKDAKFYLGTFIPSQNFKIDVFNENKLKYFKNLLRNINYCDLTNDKEFEENLFNLIYELMVNGHFKIASNLIERVITSKISLRVEDFNGEFKIKNLNDLDLKLVIDLFNTFFKPYQDNLNQLITKINEDFVQTLPNDSSEKQKKKLCKNFLKSQSNTHSIDQYVKTILIFLRLHHSFIINNHNETYTNLIKSSKHFYHELYTFISNFNLIKNSNITKFYLRYLLKQDIFSKNLQNSKTLKRFNILTKNLNKKEKNPINSYSIYEKFISHQKLLLSNKPLDKDLFNNISTISKLFLTTTDKKTSKFIVDYIINLKSLKISKKEIHKIYNKLHKICINSLTKIKTGNILLISDRTKISNLFTIYGEFIKFYIIANPWDMITVTQNLIEIFSLAAEKKYDNVSTLLQFLIPELVKIRLKQPKEFTLVEKKLNCFPNLKNLENLHKLNINSKFSKKYADNINKQNEKIKLKSKKLIENSKQMFISYADNLKLNKISQNLYVNHWLNIHMVLSMSLILNLSNKEDYEIFSKYEKIFYSDLISNISYIQKKVSLVLFGHIQRIKRKYLKQFTVVKYTEEDYLKAQTNIILETKDNLAGLYCSKKNSTFVLTNSESSINPFSDIDHEFISNFKNREEFSKFLNILLDMKDTLNDQSLMKSGGGLSELMNNMSVGFEQIELITKLIQNPIYKQGTSSNYHSEGLITQSLFDKWECNLFFYLFNSGYIQYTFNDIFEIFEKFVETSNKDKIVPISILLHFISGKIKHEIKMKNFSNIRENLFRVMKYFTSSSNRRIDNEIFNYFSYVIDNLTLKEFHSIFFDSTNSSFLIYNYDSDFVLEFMNIVVDRFHLKSHLIFDDKSVNSFNLLVENYLSDSVLLVKNLTRLKLGVSSIVLLRNMFFYNFDEFDFNFDKILLKNLLEKILKISKSIEIKEMKQLCIHLVSMYLVFLFEENNLPLLIDYLLEICKITYLDIEEFEKHLDFIRSSFKFRCYTFDFSKFLVLIETHLKTVDNIHSRKFLIDIASALFKSNLNNYNNFDNYEIYLNSFLRMISCSQFEIKDYVVNNLFINFVNSLDEDINNRIIEDIKHSIISNEYKHVTNQLSAIFVLGTYLKPFSLKIPSNIENLILKLKEFNIKIFKNRGAESKQIKNLIAEFYNKYKYTFNYAKKTLSIGCQEAITELSRSTSYFI